MAGDIGIRERAVILPGVQGLSATSAAGPAPKRRVVHMYGTRVMIVEDSSEAGSAGASDLSLEPTADVMESLQPDEKLGLAAYQLRESSTYKTAKANRPKDGESWDSSSEMQRSC